MEQNLGDLKAVHNALYKNTRKDFPLLGSQLAIKAYKKALASVRSLEKAKQRNKNLIARCKKKLNYLRTLKSNKRVQYTIFRLEKRILKLFNPERYSKIEFKNTSSIHYDARTMTLNLQNHSVTLFAGIANEDGNRVGCKWKPCDFNDNYLNSCDKIDEAELVCKKGRFFLHLVLTFKTDSSKKIHPQMFLE